MAMRDRDLKWAPADDPVHIAFFNAVRSGTVDDVRAAFKPDIIDINSLEGDESEGRTALHTACFDNGNLEVIEFLLRNGANVNVWDRNRAGNSQPLHWAAHKDRAEVVHYLLEHGAERNQKGFDGRSALGMVLYYSLSPRTVEPQQLATIQVLLDYGFGVDEAGMLFEAVTSRDLSLVKFLFDHGGSINPQTESAPSLLGHAAGYTDYKTVKFLLDHGAALTNPVDGNPNAPLVSAASNGNLEMVKLLLEHSDLDTIVKSSAALGVAAAGGYQAVVETLLDAGMKLGMGTGAGTGRQSPIHAACYHDKACPDLVQLLLDKGMDINLRDDGANTPLHLHVSTRRPDRRTIKLLLASGADLTARNTNGETPLLRAASAVQCHYQEDTAPHEARGSAFIMAIKLLLKAGADMQARDYQKRTALHLLAMNSPLCMPGECPERAAYLLLEKGVDIDAVDAKGHTAADILKEKGTIEARLILHAISNFQYNRKVRKAFRKVRV
ncbi:hypothetical protein FQN57_004618 [Myotisia sp. PD_48]|nr:hypothetical protein FQN57_004618 [Myotisia sp. PD_48]